MTTTPHEDIEQIKKYFEDIIKSIKETRVILKRSLFGNLEPHTPKEWEDAASRKPLNAIAYLSYDHLEDIYLTLQDLGIAQVESIEKIDAMESGLEKIAQETKVDISDMKNQLSEVRKQMEAPIYQYTKKQQEDALARQKTEAEILDWSLRSH